MLKILNSLLCLIIPLAVAVSAFGSNTPVALLSAQSNSSPYQMKNVYEPETSISAPPTVITRIDNEKKLKSLNADGERTQVALFNIEDTSLNIIIDNKTHTISEIFDACATAVIPMFTASDTDTAKAFAEYVVNNDIFDVILASDKTEALSAAYDTESSAIRYAYLAGSISEENSAEKIALDTHTANANIAIINQAAALSRADAEYLQLRGIAVWLDSNESNDRQRVFNAVDIGANGVIVNSFSTAYNMYEKVRGESPVSIRKSFIVGHRGAPTAAPENSLASFDKAISLGADAVEADIWMALDGTLVCCHNGTIDGYTTDSSAKGSVMTKTWDQLSQYTLRKKGAFENEQFCKVEWLFELLQKNPDIVAFVELKDAREKAVAATVSLMESMGVEKQIFFISFDKKALEYAREYAPYCGTGYLASAPYDEADSINENLMEIMNSIGNLSATPDYIYSSEISSSVHSVEFVKAASHRGILMQAWTIRDQDDMVSLAKNGVTSITTDYPTWSKNEHLHTYKSISAQAIFPNSYTGLIICICAAVAVVAAVSLTCIIIIKRKKNKSL